MDPELDNAFCQFDFFQDLRGGYSLFRLSQSLSDTLPDFVSLIGHTPDDFMGSILSITGSLDRGGTSTCRITSTVDILY